ncbi:MAG: hypothetical protein J0I29_10415 [Rhizobiales bacterium]|nr:hypothetical protein [Hyphomicrobiales bacterium]
MAVNQNDPYESDAEIRRRGQRRFEEDMQADPELAEGASSAGRIGLFAIAILVILGAVFYGLNNPSIAPTSTAQTTTTAPSTPASPPAGQTTGSATSTQTSPPPASSPPATGQSGDNGSNSTSPSMTPAPSPSNGGTTQPGAPANN